MTTAPSAPGGGRRPGLSIAAALSEGGASGLDRTDCAVLLGHVLGRSRTWLIAHDERLLAEDEAAAWHEAARRRLDGEPVAYILETKEFHGLRLQVGPAVLVPRPETELLVELAMAYCRTLGKRSPRIVDLGTGSGAIALACKAEWPDAEVCASDSSEAALDVAHRNARETGLDIMLRAGPWWEPWAGDRFDVALCNPPYVAAADPHLAALRHEPRAALVAGDAGLADLRAVVGSAPGHIYPGGCLWVEHGHEQAGAVTEFLRAAGFSMTETRRDLSGHPRCTGGIRSLAQKPSDDPVRATETPP